MITPASQHPESDDEQTSAPPADNVTPLPRRTLANSFQTILAIDEPLIETLPYKVLSRGQESFKCGLATFLRRLFAWFGVLTRFLVGRVRYRKDPRENAVRLRLMLQGLGGAAIKIGQQLAVRTDVLPIIYCDELEKLLDDVPPFPTDQALAIIEADTGKPLAANFLEFDPTPIGSGSIACVYRAVLHDGKAVAVKVRRPNIDTMLVADVRAISVLCRVSEWLGIARPGKWTPVVIELERMLTDELTFLLEAHQIGFFRKETKRQKIKSVTAPKVYYSLCSHRIVVTAFVTGVSMKDILNAVDRHDRPRLAELKSAGYDPVKLSKKWIRFFFWELFDSVIFHADPHPGNIIVQPGNKMVLIDFGCCGCVTAQYRTNLYGVNQSVVDQNLEAMVQSTVENQQPLPPIDVDAYMAELKEVLRKFLIRSKSKYVPWDEKTTSGVLREMQSISQRYNVPIKPDILRVFRATLLSDSMAYRLNPNFDANKEFRKWSQKRDAQRRKDALKRRSREGGLDPLSLETFVSSLHQITGKVEKLVSRPSFVFKQSVRKLAYTASIIISTLKQVVILFAGVTLFRWLYLYIQSGETGGSFIDNAKWTLSRSWFEAACVILGAIAIGKIHLRAQDIDVDQSGSGLR